MEVFARWGLTSTSVDMRDAENVARALRKETRLVWVETPSNPLLAVTDIARVAALAHEAGAICGVDNTWATMVAQRQCVSRLWHDDYASVRCCLRKRHRAPKTAKWHALSSA